MKFAIIIIITCISFHLEGQDYACVKSEYDSLLLTQIIGFGDNSVLTQKDDSIQSISLNNGNCTNCRTINGGISSEINTIFQIPLSITNYTPFDENRLEHYVNRANDVLANNNSKFMFYVDNIVNQNNNVFLNYVNDNIDNPNDDPKKNGRYVAGSTNWHVTANPSGGEAVFPWRNNRHAFNTGVRNSFDNQLIDLTIGVWVHEMGHTLGLLHTQDAGRGARGWPSDNNAENGNCTQEYVNKSRTQNFPCFGWYNDTKSCSINSDMICDTDASPRLILTNNGFVSGFRSAIPTGLADECDNLIYQPLASDPIDYFQDNDGDGWLTLGPGGANALTNIMSSHRDDCYLNFTPMQRGRMYHYILEAKNKHNWHNYTKNIFVDVYENDNYWKDDNNINFRRDANNEIMINQIQHHAFHLSSIDPTYRDIDWLFFVVENQQLLTIFTEEVNGYPATDTHIIVREVNPNGSLGSIVVQDNGSAQYSNLTFNFAPGEYAIQVISGATSGVLISGHYLLSVRDDCFDIVQNETEIIGNNAICTTSSNYSLANVPPGVTSYSWTITNPHEYIISSPNTNTTNITLNNSNYSGYDTITVVMTGNGCSSEAVEGITMGNQKNIWGNYPQLNTLQLDGQWFSDPYPFPCTISGTQYSLALTGFARISFDYEIS